MDANGKVVDGDAVMLMCATVLKAEGRLSNNAIVATVMSNIGLEIALREAGIDLVRCPVGDKYVMEEMARRGIALGGEQSGHVIFSDYLFTGDGLATALGVLRTMATTGRSLADLASDLTTYPQVLMNLRVKEKVDLADRAADRRRAEVGRVAARRLRPPARPLFRHRAAAARDAGGQGPGRDRPLGPGDHRHGRPAPGPGVGRDDSDGAPGAMDESPESDRVARGTTGS